MTISTSKINSLFIQEDIEGLIDLGAPNDEYSTEAKNISSALSELKSEEFTEENIIALIAMTWMQSFNLSEAEIGLRLPSIQRIAKEIISKK